MLTKHSPLVLIILDGWGYRQEQDANAINAAVKPNWDKLWHNYPHTVISGSGLGVGLPEDQMGNSEVGHLNLGAGRIVYQEFTRINKAIQDKDFYSNPVLLGAINKAKAANKAVHIMGLLSPGGVHSHENHLQAMVELAVSQKVPAVYVHAFLDGRDTPPRSALASITAMEALFKRLGKGQFASVIGRYYAMDRDKRWERTQIAYDLLTLGEAPYHADSATVAVNMAYARDESDEFVQATSIHATEKPPITIEDGDVVIFMNYRADRTRQLTRAFTEEDFSGFVRRKTPKLNDFVTLTQYAADIKANVAFPAMTLTNGLGEYLANLGLKQLRIAETEKYAHVTFFFNGGVEQAFPGEDRILVSSPAVATYDLQPQMSAYELTDKLVAAIRKQQYAVIICNYANADMVGHTGNFAATVKAIEAIDQCIGQILAALAEVGGEALITADHGNAEQMFDEATQQAHTAHTHEPVPLIYVGRPASFTVKDGALSDIAPTMLYLMGLAQPKEMTGRVLVNLK